MKQLAMPIIALLSLTISCAPTAAPQPQIALSTATAQAPTATATATPKPTFTSSPTSTATLTNTPTPTSTPTPIPTPKSIAQRIADRVFPSIFQAWNKADNLSGEDSDRTMSRHDLAWYGEGQLGLRWDNTFAGLATSFTTASLSGARLKRNVLLGYNPNIIMLAEVTYRDIGSNWLPPDHSWWRRDANGNRVIGWDEGGYYMLDWHNPSFRTQVINRAKAVIESGVFDGIILDWWDDDDPDRISMLQGIRNTIGGDKLIIINTNTNTARNAAPYVNGLFMESCIWSRQQQSCLAPNTPQDWQKIANTLLWAETNLREPRINALETWYVNSRNDLNRMRATTTLALTHSNGYALFSDPNYLPGPDHLHNWYTFWDQKSLGKPIAAMTRRPDGAFQREFTGGTVIYNPMGNSAITVVFAGPRFSAASGQTATTFNLQAMDGDLYLKGVATAGTPAATTTTVVSDVPTVTKGTFTVVVPGNAGWINTRVRITSGQVVTVSTSGIVNLWGGTPQSNSEPNGFSSSVCSNSRCAMQGTSYGVIVGRLGSSEPFKIGASSQFTASTTGDLYLAVNDDYYPDNSGAFTATFSVR